ncbi:MAG: SAF domain-containing protein [Archangium sp.]
MTVGLVLAISCIGSGGMFGLSQVLRAKERAGWNLVPVIVAAVDIEPNTVLGMEMISQRSLPEQFVNSDIVKPDSASYVVNVRTGKMLHAGDPLRWNDMVDVKREKLVLFAGRAIEPGETITSQDVVAHPLDPSLLTASWVEEGALPADRKVTVAMKEGDPILWTHFAAPADAR